MTTVDFTKLYEFYDDYNRESSLPKIYNYLFGNDVSEERRLLISDIKTHNSIIGTNNTTSILNLLYFNKTRNDVQNKKAFYLNKFILNNLSGKQISELLKDDIFDKIYFIKHINDIINKNNHNAIVELYKDELIMKILYIFFMRGLRNNIFLEELKKIKLHNEFKEIILNIFYYVRTIISNKNKEKTKIYKSKHISFKLLHSELEKKIFNKINDYKKVNKLISLLEDKDISISKNSKSSSISPFYHNSTYRKKLFDQLKNTENIRSLMIHSDTIEIPDTGKSYKQFVYDEEINFENEEPLNEPDKAIRLFPNGKIYKFTEEAYTFDMLID
jgi:hypothetical protein